MGSLIALLYIFYRISVRNLFNLDFVLLNHLINNILILYMLILFSQLLRALLLPCICSITALNYPLIINCKSSLVLFAILVSFSPLKVEAVVTSALGSILLSH